jgi:hypothetical protein
VTKFVVIASDEIMQGNLKSLDNNFSPSNLVSFPAKKLAVFLISFLF